MSYDMDHGIAQEDAISVSGYVNGRVAVQNLNGLDARLQSIIFLKYTLLDFVTEEKTERLSFTWRRSSQMEATGHMNSHGQPIKEYIPRTWEINVSLDKQRP